MNREIRVGLIVAAALILVSGVSAQTERTLYSFSGYADGGNPLSSLVIDAAGNLYGTTFVGGAQGAGEVFELSPKTSGGGRSLCCIASLAGRMERIRTWQM